MALCFGRKACSAWAAGLLCLALAGASRAQSLTCQDPSRTIFAGDPFSEACLQFDNDPQSCEMAWHIGGNATPGDPSDDRASSCFFLDGRCRGCGPNNEAAGLCTNTCIPPAAGTPIPCTIGFWKNRAETPTGQAQHFPDPEFDQLVAAAVLRSPAFGTAPELLAALLRQGRRSPEEKARQQLAALLLNLAAGELFPDNQKCELFAGNALSENSCVGASGVGQALEQVLGHLAAGAFEDAKDCADDVNNGVGVLGAETSE